MKNRKTPKHISITVAGVTYNDIRAAWRDLSPPDLPEITVRKRLAAGWPTGFAFLISPMPPTERRRGYEEYLQALIL